MHVLTNFQRKIQQILRMISILRPFAFLSTHPVKQNFLTRFYDIRVLMN